MSCEPICQMGAVRHVRLFENINRFLVKMLSNHNTFFRCLLQFPRRHHPVPLLVKDEHPPTEVEAVVFQSPLSFTRASAATCKSSQSLPVELHLEENVMFRTFEFSQTAKILFCKVVSPDL